MSSFASALYEAHRQRLPVIALRDDSQGKLDDVVIDRPTSIHAEMMDTDRLWIGVDLVNGERICFDIWARKRGCLEFAVCEHPEGGFMDWDQMFHVTREKPGDPYRPAPGQTRSDSDA